MISLLRVCSPVLPVTHYSRLMTAPGGSAKAAGELVAKLGGKVYEYLFIIELTFLKAADKLDAPLYSIVQSDD